MKVFMVHEDPWHAGNPYIYTLIEEIRKQYPECEMAWGRTRFWSEEIYSYDIVHFHWPQAFMAYDTHTEADLQQHIEKMKKHGMKIVATCHDLEPHYDQCADKAEAMKIVYRHCDAVFHLGDYSKTLFEERYPNAAHFLLPHHLYDTVYHCFPTRTESLRHLRLSERYTYILCFGTFRAEAERQLVISLCKHLKDKNIAVLAPGFMDARKPSLNLFSQIIKKLYYRYKYNIRCTGKTWGAVSDNDLPYYYGAADLAFIHRLKILNSGNAMMPMLYGKVVVGPDCGNVGLLLKEWGYPVFQVDKLDDLPDIISKGLEMGKTGYGSLHRESQLSKYSTAAISEKLYSMYKSITKP